MKTVIFYLSLFSICLTTTFPCHAQKLAGKEYPWAWTGFTRPDNVNPIISPNPNSVFYCPMKNQTVAWEESDTFNPAATIMNGKVVVLYRAEDNSATGIGSRTSRIGYASSEDGLTFKRLGSPVLFPANDDQAVNETPGGCEDPRVAMTEDGTYVMTYTQWNRKKARLSIATSRDLVHWTKYGPAFAKAYDGRFANNFCKSGSILTKMKDGKLVIAKIKGKYLMYWGEQFVNLATSTDLKNWTPMLDKNNELLKIMVPRKNKFDSQLTECGPPAIITKDGILLFYNGKNLAGKNGDQNYTGNSYCAGQALFDIKNPTKIVKRLDKPFFIPEADFEKSGQYPAGTVFIEGLVPFKNKWFLYYGCADSRVSVAVYDPTK